MSGTTETPYHRITQALSAHRTALTGADPLAQLAALVQVYGLLHDEVARAQDAIHAGEPSASAICGGRTAPLGR